MSDSTPSYLTDFLRSPGNVSGLLGGAAIATVLSFPFGLLGAALPLLITAGIEVIACLFVPDMATFRRWADDQRKIQSRAEAIERVMSEIRKRCTSPNQFRQFLDDHQVIAQQVMSLLDLAKKKPGVLGLEDMERIADVPSEYLSFHLSLLVMDERAKAIDLRDITKKLALIRNQIERPEEGADLRQLERARTEYEALVARQQRMMSKRPAIEAAIVSLPDQLAEIYQMVMGEGAQNDGARLTDAIGSLRLRQDIESEIAEDLSGAIPDLQARKTMTGTTLGVRSLH